MGAHAGVAWALCQVRGHAQLSLTAYSKKLARGERPQAGPCPSHPTGDKMGLRSSLWEEKLTGLFTVSRDGTGLPRSPCFLGGVNWKQGTYLEGSAKPPLPEGGRWP